MPPFIRRTLVIVTPALSEAKKPYILAIFMGYWRYCTEWSKKTLHLGNIYGLLTLLHWVKQKKPYILAIFMGYWRYCTEWSKKKPYILAIFMGYWRYCTEWSKKNLTSWQYSWVIDAIAKSSAALLPLTEHKTKYTLSWVSRIIYILSCQLKLIRMRAKLANQSDCAVPFLSRSAANLCWYYIISVTQWLRWLQSSSRCYTTLFVYYTIIVIKLWVT